MGKNPDTDVNKKSTKKRRVKKANIVQQSALIDVKSFLKNTKNFHDKHATEATILFADLANSTKFKLEYPGIEGLAKVVLHNDLACDAISSQDGEVNKLLGDGAMAVFEGANRQADAIKVGLDLINKIEAENKQPERTGLKKLATKIGINSGPVYFFKSDCSTNLDPQGCVVDIAARLSALADGQQIICTDECYSYAKDAIGDHLVCEPTKRFVKGIDESLSLRSVQPAGITKKHIRLVGVTRETSDKHLELLAKARDLFKDAKYKDAMKAFSNLAKEDTGHFEANFRLAELYLHHANGSPSNKPKHLKKAIEHICVAKQTNPLSCRVWITASWAHELFAELTHDYNKLDIAIKYAKKAIQCASDLMDIEGMQQAKIILARQLVARSVVTADDSAKDIALANEYCHELRKSFDAVQGHRKSEFFATFALVRLAQGDESFEDIEDMIRIAGEADKTNARVHKAREQLTDVQKRKSHSFIGLY